MEIKNLTTDEEIEATFPVMSQLRPHLDEGEYLATIRHMQNSDGYRLAAGFEDDRSRCVAGYRVSEFLAYGKILYVDDLVTNEDARSRDFGGLRPVAPRLRGTAARRPPLLLPGRHENFQLPFHQRPMSYSEKIP